VTLIAIEPKTIMASKILPVDYRWNHMSLVAYTMFSHIKSIGHRFIDFYSDIVNKAAARTAGLLGFRPITSLFHTTFSACQV
jgi:hypothetical protein